MANATKSTTTKNAPTTAKPTQISELKAEAAKEIDVMENLKKENEEIKTQLQQLMSMLTKLNRPVETAAEKPVAFVEENISSDVPEEPLPNKMIRIMSLCRGSLNLSEDEAGTGKIKFFKYGEIKTVLYSSLVNIVNYNRSFAEKGLFYILDKAAIYYLSLSDSYAHLVKKDVLDNIHTYGDADIVKIIESTEKSQVDIMVKNLIDRVYNGENIDFNKIQLISQRTGVDILGKVKEMQGFGRLK